MLPCALMGADVGPRVCCGSTGGGRCGSEALKAICTNLMSSSSGANIFASTSFSKVKCRTSSFGRAVMASAKCVIAGKISTWFSSRDALGPKPAAAEIEDLGGLFRVCRNGWALRLEECSA